MVRKRKPTRRDKQKAQTRVRILRTAEKLFDSEGYDDTTIADVAKRSKVATGTVLMHFVDKRNLLAATFEEGLVAALAVDEEDKSPETEAQALVVLGAKALEVLKARPALARLVLADGLFSPGPSFESLRATVRSSLAERASELIRDSASHKGADAETVASLTEAFLGNLLTTGIAVLNAPEADLDVHAHLERQVHAWWSSASDDARAARSRTGTKTKTKDNGTPKAGPQILDLFGN